MGKNFITGSFYTGEKITDFRTNTKWANVIRTRWTAFQEATRWFYAHSGFVPMFPIIPIGKVRYTTSTFYPDPNVESTSVDGYAGRDSVDETWATIRAGAGNSASDTDTADYLQVTSAATENQWRDLYRTFYLFDTSAIGASSTVSAATLSLYGSSKIDVFSQSVCIVSTTPASNTAIVAGDYGNTSNTEQTNTRITIASFSTSAYNDFAFNATGLTNISKTSISKFGGKLSGDVDNSAPTWSVSAAGRARIINADTTGTTTDPKLVVTHAAAAGSVSPSGGVGNSSSFIII